MNLHLFAALSIATISVIDPVRGYTAELSTCADGNIEKGAPCFIHCSVAGLEENDYFGVSKVGATYYSLFEKIDKTMDVEYYSSKNGLNSKLPDRYNIFAQTGTKINITISGILPEDMGNFTCWVKKENEEIAKTSPVARLSVIGTFIEQYWERLDESGNSVQRYKNYEEITVTYEEIANVAYRMIVPEPMGQLPSFVLRVNDAGVQWDIQNDFNLDHDIEEGDISETGLISGFNMTAHYFSPQRFYFLLYTTVRFESYLFLDGSPQMTLLLNIQAPAQIEDGRCNKTLLAETGDTILFVCGMAVNPEPLSYQLKVPGRAERIDEENSGEKFDFEVKPYESNRPHLYFLHVTYYNITSEVFGTNEIFVRNDIDESSYQFTITNDGYKTGVPLLQIVASTLIVIALSFN